MKSRWNICKKNLVGLARPISVLKQILTSRARSQGEGALGHRGETIPKNPILEVKKVFVLPLSSRAGYNAFSENKSREFNECSLKLQS